MKLSTLTFSILFLFASYASANVQWPDRPKKNYSADFDFRVSGAGSVKSAYIHTFYSMEVGATYMGATTDEYGEGTGLVYTIFVGEEAYEKEHFTVPTSTNKLECEADNNPIESDGHVSCEMKFDWKKDTWYRLSMRSTGKSEAADGTPLRNWTAWVIELDADGNTKKKTKIATIGAPLGWLLGAQISTVENFAYHDDEERCEVLKNDWANAIVEIGYPVYNGRTSWAKTPDDGQSFDDYCKPLTIVDPINRKLKGVY